MGTVGKAFEAVQTGKKAFKQGKEIHGKVMEVHGKIQEVIPLSKDIPKNRAEFLQASKTAIKHRHEIYGNARELHGQVLDIHDQVMDIHGQVMGIQGQFQETQQQTPERLAVPKTNPRIMREALRAWTIGSIFCITVLLVSPHKPRNSSIWKMGAITQSKHCTNIYFLPSAPLLRLPFLKRTSWVPAWRSKPSSRIMDTYLSAYIFFDIILMPVVAGVFIWWFISTLKPWKRIFRAFLCFFIATLLIPAVLQTFLVYRTIYVLKHHIDFTTSSLMITTKSNFLYLFCIHFFWCLLLLNMFGFRLLDCFRHRRKTRKIHQAQEIIKDQENQDFSGKVYVGEDGIRDVLYDTKHHEYSELQKLAPTKQSTGIARKSVEIEYENDDLEKANWRRGLNTRHDKLDKEKWGADNV
ncbi:hypothetical protein EYC84_004336 [Monilinia fructicola]|uniref:Uncharacterized protein n=1 Tax=Monilinia fructicola TaxID=38448 RepID=A0A5M9K4P1_MONFR|nr:hypothetical protein EYC84_004336 [Monilinia fructicola]